MTSPVVTTVQMSPKETLEIICNEQVNFEPKGNDVDTNPQCPFSGLPAAHLLIKKSPKIGNLQRIKEKTYIFNQSRMKYYSGLLDCWLLMYSNSNELKPTICLNLQNFDLCSSDLYRKREQFQLISNEYKTDYSRSPKKYLLQATSASDYEEWLLAITTATKSSLTRLRSNSISRKLPSPPLSSTETEFTVQTRLSDRSEGIYEEPSEMFTTQLYPSFQFDNWTQLPVAPALPIKSGLKSKNECTDQLVAQYDIPKSPPKPTDIDSEHQNKIQQVKNHLTMQMLTPKQVTKPSIIVDEEKSKFKKKSKIETSEVPKFTKRNWFLNRLSGGRNGNGRLKVGMENAAVNDISITCEPVEGRFDGKRGGKVNMIINQLEANGHFPLRKEKFKESRYSKCSITNDEDEDCHNYEPVVVTGRMK